MSEPICENNCVADSVTKLRTGMKDVSKAIRKNEQGMVVLAGNVSPIDIYSHIPAICEEKGLPYIYTPSKEQLGLAVCLSTHSQLEAYPRVLAHTPSFEEFTRGEHILLPIVSREYCGGDKFRARFDNSQ